MSHTDGKKRRVVIVHHPDFDLPGSEGINEALDFAKEWKKGQTELCAQAKQSGESEEVIAQIIEYSKKFQIVVRSIDDKVI